MGFQRRSIGLDTTFCINACLRTAIGQLSVLLKQRPKQSNCLGRIRRRPEGAQELALTRCRRSSGVALQDRMLALQRSNLVGRRPWRRGGKLKNRMGGGAIIGIVHHLGPAFRRVTVAALSPAFERTDMRGASKTAGHSTGRLGQNWRNSGLYGVHLGVIKDTIPHHRTTRRSS